MDLDVLPNAQCTQFHGKWAEKDRNFGVTLMIEPVFMRATREGVKIIVVIITAFSNLFGSGGAPIFSINRGKGNIKKAEVIMNTSFSMLCICGVALMVIGMLMIPKTCAYVWTVLIGYKTMKKEVPFLNGQKDTVGSLACLFL